MTLAVGEHQPTAEATLMAPTSQRTSGSGTRGGTKQPTEAHSAIFQVEVRFCSAGSSDLWSWYHPLTGDCWQLERTDSGTWQLTNYPDTAIAETFSDIDDAAEWLAGQISGSYDQDPGCVELYQRAARAA